MESAKNAKKINKTEENNANKCMLCKAGFDVWVSTLNFPAEREEKLRMHFLKYCPDCAEKNKNLTN